MATGFKYGVYLKDNGDPLVVRVEADRFAAGDFDWTAAAAGADFTGYGTLRPRHVLGFEASSGKRAKAIVPDLGSDIWTGVATSFLAKDDDGVSHTYVVTSRVGERRQLAR